MGSTIFGAREYKNITSKVDSKNQSSNSASQSEAGSSSERTAGHSDNIVQNGICSGPDNDNIKVLDIDTETVKISNDDSKPS